MPKPVVARKLPPYRGQPYWEREKPQEVKTGRIWLSYYPGAGKLQIAGYFTKDGEDVRTKVVTLNQEDLTLHPAAKALLSDFLTAAE
ncbi:MAG: hypothetical protein D9V47_13795 [Clostridia bacterium]|nr:MAG: hypothetical protein D9V47_13795 [Clostridia bacterium]